MRTRAQPVHEEVESAQSRPAVEPASDTRHVLRAHDGADLHVRELVAPAASAAGPRVVLGHAMMVDGRTLYRPGRPSLAQTLLQAGLSCYVSEARGRDGRGGQPMPLDFGYDDHVRDVGRVLEFVRSRGDGPLVLLGHSLFGHTSLAHLARYPASMRDSRAPVVAHVSLSSGIWLPSCEPRAGGRGFKRALMTGIDLLVALEGVMPARRLRIGSCDEPARYWADMRRFWREDRYGSDDGFDYRAAFGQVSIPTLQVVSDGDTWMTPPRCVVRFGAPLPRREVWHLGPTQRRISLRGVVPSHMGMLTDPASEPLWRELAEWIVARGS